MFWESGKAEAMPNEIQSNLKSQEFVVFRYPPVKCAHKTLDQHLK